MKGTTSIRRRIILIVLSLEILGAIGLIAAVTVHERHVQIVAFDANLRGTVDSIMGAVQDAEDERDNVMLDLSGISFRRDAIYRVVDEQGRILGAAGEIPKNIGDAEVVHHVMLGSRSYRFLRHEGQRIIDPGKNGGIRHQVSIIYGLPDRRIWHEVAEASRFFALATAVLLSLTTALMLLLVRRSLRPIHELASAAEKINSIDWRFRAPESAKEIEELSPLATGLESAVARLERSYQQQKRFTSDAAHELKTDLAIVKSSLQLLSMKTRTVEEYGKGLTLSLEDFTRLERTVYTMLTLARLEQPIEVYAECLFNEAVEEAIQQSAPFAELKEISIVPKNLQVISVPLDTRDASLLISNLILNALQHSEAHSSVIVEMATSKDFVELTVRDHGEGIREEDREFLFEPFYRGDPSRSRKSGGTGLGLSICKSICVRVGGSIEIANHSERGAVVTVRLPLVKQKNV